jgi:hypothetical protein
MYRPRWYELPIEVGFVVAAGPLTYLMCRSIWGLSKITAYTAAAAAMLVVGLSLYWGHRLRAKHIESLPIEEQVAVAWKFLRIGLIGGTGGLLAAGFGVLGTYLIIWREAFTPGFTFLGASLALGVTVLFVLRRRWPKSPGAE